MARYGMGMVWVWHGMVWYVTMVHIYMVGGNVELLEEDIQNASFFLYSGMCYYHC